MVATFSLISGSSGGQSAQVDLTTQGVNDPQHIFQPHRGLASLEVNNEAHTNPRRQRQLRLGQPEMLASGTQCIAELLR